MMDHKQGEVIICLHPSTNNENVSQRHAYLDNTPTGFVLDRCLSAHMNIWKGSFDYTKVNELSLINQLNEDGEIVVAQLNHFLKPRNLLSNDPRLDEQWQWINMGERGLADADIDADEAWSFTTGGVTQLGDTIVVAVLDVGVYDQHEDLRSNIWINHREIPGNNIDDDQNGYVDDYRGWNVLFANDSIDPEIFGGDVEETHGTEILGVIGAVGNNGIGITGINWNVKMMNVLFNSDLNEADMIAAYGYVLDQRKRYNATNGAEGAFVVATNLSYGDEELTPEETPIWCAVYDSLGSQGILNCTATANASIDIDSIRDVPTSCASQYMIAVTATNDSDVRSFAAYGKNDIDIAAPGAQLLTTSIPDYDFVSGTSFASPIVAGAIGLLYGSPCGDLAALARVSPAEAALTARSLILDQVDPIAALEDEISSGGRLNIFNSLNAIFTNCQSCVAPFDVQAGLVDSDPTQIQIAWAQADSVMQVDFNWRAAGDTVWIQMDSVTSPFTLNDLAICQTYEFMLTATCQDGTVSSTPVMDFMTEGCCLPPSAIEITNSTDSSIAISFEGSAGSAGYFAIIGAISDSITWDTSVINQGDSTRVLEGLQSCTEYYLLLQTICQGAGGISSSDTIQVRTLGCGACLDSVYCALPVNAVGDEWIEAVSIHNLNIESGFDNGYGDYTGNSTQLKQGNGYTLNIQPGYAADTLEEYYFAWIDYNQNGEFDDEGEQVFASDTAISTGLETVIRIPEDAPLGLTRMRVMMLFDPIEDVVSGCTTAIDLGEAEDFCVEIIIDSLLCPKPVGLDTLDYQGTSTLVVWEAVDSAIAYVVRHRKVGDEEWEEVVDTMNSFNLMEMENCETYEVQVQTVCGRDTSGYTESLFVAAACNTAVEDVATGLEVEIYPNPFSLQLSLEIQTEERQDLNISLLQLDGKQIAIKQVEINAGEHIISIDELSYLPPGMYLVSLQNAKGRLVKKVFKQ
ncbi:MAG: S8 family serine peptidase [Saprospiraceae bacterium]|nr:S8 family serine peptidase [Saprospiraceae bacterium]